MARRDNTVNKLNFKKHDVEKALLKQARREGNIVYGAQAIKRRLGINARPTKDYDMFSKMPKKSALKSQDKLDRIFRRDVFFAKKGANPTTYKVKHKGMDLKPNTKDDIGIADFTKTPSPEPKTFKFRGVKYRTLREELKAKQKLLRSKGFEFRRMKDLEDLRRIKKFGVFK